MQKKSANHIARNTKAQFMYDRNRNFLFDLNPRKCSVLFGLLYPFHAIDNALHYRCVSKRRLTQPSPNHNP